MCRVPFSFYAKCECIVEFEKNWKNFKKRLYFLNKVWYNVKVNINNNYGTFEATEDALGLPGQNVGKIKGNIYHKIVDEYVNPKKT